MTQSVKVLVTKSDVMSLIPLTYITNCPLTSKSDYPKK